MLLAWAAVAAQPSAGEELGELKKRRDAEITERQKLGQSLANRGASPRAKPSCSAPARALDTLTRDFDQAIQRLGRDVAGERWRLFLIGFPMDVLLGGFFATALTVNAVQALAIGFGWTALADRIGLQRALDVKKQLTREQISRIESASIEELTQRREENRKLEGQLAAATALAQRPPPRSRRRRGRRRAAARDGSARDAM